MSKGKKFLSDLKFYTDYAKWLPEQQRYETWEEACDAVLNTHLVKYGDKVQFLLDEVRPLYYDKTVLASQRNLQFRGDQIFSHNPRMFNCCTTYCYTPDVFSKGFYILLCGTGLGVSMRQKFIKQLPVIHTPKNGTETFIVEDSIQGWADAAHVLISTYCQHPSLYSEWFGKKVRFDYSNIREEGAMISGGFKAPGPKGLKQSLERIEALILGALGTNDTIEFRSIIAYDIFMHLSDAVLSGGVRRSAMNIIMDWEDQELVYAKIGDWRTKFPWRARSNNSVGLIRGQFTKEQFEEILKLNEGDNDIGFVFSYSENVILNPCYEISFDFYDFIPDKNLSCFQLCNLNEIIASSLNNSKGEFSPSKFKQACRTASILGTLQAGYVDFPHINKQTSDIVAGEALLGVSITGWMNCPELFEPALLEEGVRIVRETNEEVAKLIGINPAARLTCVKPSGNSSVLAMTASGIHPEHSKRYFRVMQINKESDTAKWLVNNMPEVLEESKWSASNTDYVVFVPCENKEGTMYKEDMQGVKHLELIRLVQNHWVKPGKIYERSYTPHSMHNVSNTVILDNPKEVTDYVFEHQEDFTAVSFLTLYGDKDYVQAPFTSVLNSTELLETYGEGVMFVSGLIVDGLNYFNGDLWEACLAVGNREFKIVGNKEQVLLRKDWVRRVKKFAKNYLNGDLNKIVYCLKDVYLWHKWNVINRSFKTVDFTQILEQPTYKGIADYAAVACAGGSCEVKTL